MADRTAHKRKLSETETESVMTGIDNLRIPDEDGDVGMEDDDDELALVTELVNLARGNTIPGYDQDAQTDHNNQTMPRGPIGRRLWHNRIADIDINPAVVNPRGVTITIRACFNGKYATPPFSIPAHFAQKMWMVLDILQEKMEWVDMGNGFDANMMKLSSEPLFLLQETTFNTHRIRYSPFIPALNNVHGNNYIVWYHRNVQRGQETEVKIEVRFRTDRMFENEDLFRRAGRGEVRLNNQGYRPLNIEGNDFIEIWELLSNTPGAVTGSLPDQTEPGTATYFPERRHRPNTVVQQGNIPEAMALTVPQGGSSRPAPGREDPWNRIEEDPSDIDWEQWRVDMDEANFAG